MPVRRVRFVASALVFVGVVVAPDAHAFESQWHAGVDLGYAGLSWDGEVRSGLGGGLHGAYGLSDEFNLLLEVGASTHSVCDACSSLRVVHGATGVAYTLDVISWVPYAGLLVGGYGFAGGDLPSAAFRLGFQGALGMDYRPSRWWAVGIQLRYHTLASEPLQTHYVTTFGRFELLWGW